MVDSQSEMSCEDSGKEYECYAKRNADLVLRMIDEGHIVGNHTVNHPNLAKVDLKTVYDELNGLNEIYKEKYGENPPEEILSKTFFKNNLKEFLLKNQKSQILSSQGSVNHINFFHFWAQYEAISYSK